MLRLTLLLSSAFLVLPLHAQAPANADVQAIQHLMAKQVADWNRGDIDNFATGYKNSPDIIFVSRALTRGYQGMLQRYHSTYPTRAAMGTLSFRDLEIVLLDDRFATATGTFHLDRIPSKGDRADGIFSLVYEKTPLGWKIIRDHTTAFPPTSTH